jgi:ABC-type antimicrobial peptide transport system permease subunit
MKRLLMSGLHLVAAILMTVVIGIYAGINAVMITRVLNDWRLDTYMGVETGLNILLLLVMLVYIPAWAFAKLVKS